MALLSQVLSHVARVWVDGQMFPVQSETFCILTHESVGLTDLVVYIIVGLQSSWLLNEAVPLSFFMWPMSLVTSSR
jgi:hypothetical protein